MINLRTHIIIPRKKTFLEIQECISYKASREARVKYLKLLAQKETEEQKERTKKKKFLNNK